MAAPRPAQDSLLITVIATVAALYFAREVLIPITLAILLSFVLAPLVVLFRRIRLGRTPSVLLAVLLALGVILAIGGVIGTQIAGLAEDVPHYAHTIERKLDTLRSMTIGRLEQVANRLGHQLTVPDGTTAAQSPNPQSPQTQPVPVEMHQPAPGPLELANRYLSPALSPVTTVGIVFVVAIFILMQREDLRDRLIRVLGSGDLHGTTLALDDGAHRLSRYFLAQLAVNAGFGTAVGIGLMLIGVPNPVLWGIVSGLLRFVPYVGSLLAAVFPTLLAAAVDPGWSTTLWTVALYLILEPLVGQVIEPLLYGHSTGLSPVAVVIAAIFWSWIWGPVGLVLSTPLTLCLVVLGRHVPRLEFLDVLLGDQPALTPVESFYQRILAGDADEAREQAEQLLKERPLSTYYDEVALKGLQLAATDAQRGILNPDQLERIKDAIREVVEDLAHHDDTIPAGQAEAAAAPAAPADPDPHPAEKLPRHRPPRTAHQPAPERPAPWGSSGAVLCVAGRGPLDEAASAMLAQLLAKHGIGAKVMPFEEVSRRRIQEVDPEGVAMVCVSYLQISGTPAHLRYLVERLRQRMPETPLLVGLWPMEHAILHDMGLQRVVGADHYTSSLRAAVDACVTRADRGAAGHPAAA
ncbi:MAG: AI-2E family transporter [Rhodospirillales bacterium]|nr:AI-2E family transporter [Rhodospirillales bacterium]